MSFEALGLSEDLLRAVNDSGYNEPTPIQRQAIPPVLMGKDIIGVAQTGTGKTASFVLPMIDILAEGRSRARMPRSLILEPTRELAQQVSENFDKYGKYHKLTMALLIGGVSMGDQMAALEKGVDVLIATPGRLMDLFGRGKIMLNMCSLLVIDEADRMLDMGFIPDIEEICTKLPSPRQTLLFSATMPGPIKKLADRFMTDPRVIEVARPAESNALITQLVVEVSPRGKREALRSLLRAPELKNAIIFCNRKKDVRELYDTLKRAGFKAGQIHGDMDQSDRIRELDRFKSDEITILVASDVAARGLDVPGVTHVFNYDVPHHADDYVHRIGRTGRAGRTGTAYTLVTPADADNLAEVEKLIKHAIRRYTGSEAAVVADEAAPEAAEVAAAEPDAGERPARGPRRRGRGGKGRAAAEVVTAEAAEVAEAPVEAPAAEQPVEAPRAARQREERPREERPREERPREERPRNDRGRDNRGRDDRGRGRNDRDDAPSNEVGFGAEGMPAFMTVKARI
ncbi:DEAD/DEAH box helicase [Polymorphobacter arshaanensis]|uniref:DEAD-box ATP-dependent RNA helicase RhpA n=1 Tax=Glacieibacterium arshaanense TaxID=2511025 RepID=A0A4Y9EQL1_9SPHN|nr:DEAD/DEAH box helicase [Polymorphobacter arshaanensis]TFU05559.1 DEAD/DEAH box helicase [Polymorphobacter arshaanensis]